MQWQDYQCISFERRLRVLVIALAFLPATLWSDCGVREKDFFSFYFLFFLRG